MQPLLEENQGAPVPPAGTPARRYPLLVPPACTPPPPQPGSHRRSGQRRGTQGDPRGGRPGLWPQSSRNLQVTILHRRRHAERSTIPGPWFGTKGAGSAGWRRIRAEILAGTPGKQEGVGWTGRETQTHGKPGAERQDGAEAELEAVWPSLSLRLERGERQSSLLP